MYENFKKRIRALLNKNRDKKNKYEDVLKELNKKIKVLKEKGDHKSKEEIRSLEKLIKKTKLMIDSLHEK